MLHSIALRNRGNRVQALPSDAAAFHIHPISLIGNFPKNTRCINYKVMYAPKGPAYKDDQIVGHSHYKFPVDRSSNRVSGNSRIHGDASHETQRQVIDILVDTTKDYDLSRDDLAMILAIAHVESGFNPDAATGTTSASGLGQFTDRTALAYDIFSNSQRFDAITGAEALVRHYLDNKKWQHRDIQEETCTK